MAKQKETQPFILAALVCGLALGAGLAKADPVRLEVALGSPVMLAGHADTTLLKVGLKGLGTAAGHRAKVNVAIVLDRSGSMSGEKLWRAKEAAKLAIDRLSADDIVSVVIYNHTVQVLVPATKVSDRLSIFARLDAIEADGNTALFAGVAKAAQEVRKFRSDNRVNRMILLSDGLANVGPSSPGELADLGRSLGKEGISVTTVGLGLGYNEDLMTQLAYASDGNHGFAEKPSDLGRIFGLEFGDLLSVVARDVRVEIECRGDVRPLRVLGRAAEIYGQKVIAHLSQVYGNQEKYFIIEVQIPESPLGSTREVATVSASLLDPLAQRTAKLAARVAVNFTDSMAAVEQQRNAAVMIASAEFVSNDNNRRALELRDQGRASEARQVLLDNATFLDREAKKFKAPRLKQLSKANRDDSTGLESKDWGAQRKRMRAQQNSVDLNQMW